MNANLFNLLLKKKDVVITKICALDNFYNLSKYDISPQSLRKNMLIFHTLGNGNIKIPP